jgi:hypothetical protein
MGAEGEHRRVKPEPECISDEMADLMRSMTPAERLGMMNSLWRSGWRMIENLTRAEHPDWSDDRVRQEVARRMSHGTA